MTRFHSDEYVNFLQSVTPDNLESLAMQHGGLEQGIARCKLLLFVLQQANIWYTKQVITVNVGEDCPVFEGLFEFCSISAGGSIGEFDAVFFPYINLQSS